MGVWIQPSGFDKGWAEAQGAGMLEAAWGPPDH